MIEIQTLILYEDSQILVCRKPAGLAVQSARPGVPDLESMLRNYLAGARLAVVHRLDQPVEGILVFAKTPQAAKELNRQIAAGEMVKIYLAVTCGKVPAKKGMLEDYLKKDGRTNTSAVVPKGTPGSKRAVLSYEVLEELLVEKQPGGGAANSGRPAEENNFVSGESVTGAKDSVWEKDKDVSARKLLRIHLQTGRHHQIRVQLAHAGMPLLGDRKYGPADSAAAPLALCAQSLTFRHPATKKTMNFQTVPEGSGFAGFSVLCTEAGQETD